MILVEAANGNSRVLRLVILKYNLHHPVNISTFLQFARLIALVLNTFLNIYSMEPATMILE